jgi:hypothetical protein
LPNFFKRRCTLVRLAERNQRVAEHNCRVDEIERKADEINLANARLVAENRGVAAAFVSCAWTERP